MVPGDVADELDLVRREARQIAVLDQIVRMLVVLPGINQKADVVEDRAVLQPLTCSLVQPVQSLRLVEDLQSQFRHMMRVDHVVVAFPS